MFRLSARNALDGRVASIIVVFFATLLPFSTNYVFHHPDERHYTDAAIQMVRTGDYLTPRTADGQPRFHKPILTYWLVAASYQVLGISAAASRIPFLLVGGAIIWATYRVGRLLSGNPAAAILSALIIMSHPILAVSATRSIPDILLCLFLLISAEGFLAIVVFGKSDARYYAAAYVGAGLAVASKGLPAALFVAFAWGFACCNPWQRVACQRLIHVPSMIVGAVIAGGWFATVYAVHGKQAIGGFLADQATQRIALTALQPFYQFPVYCIVCVCPLLCWIVPLWRGGGWREGLLRLDPCQRQAYRFVGSWVILFGFLAGLVQKFSVRYTLPVAPLLAVVAAEMVCRTDATRVRAWFRSLLWLATGTIALALIICAVLNSQFATSAVDLAVMLCAGTTALLLLIVGLHGSTTTGAMCLTTVTMLFPLVAFLSLRHWALPDQGAQIARSLRQLAPRCQSPIAIVSKPALASKIRVGLHGAADMQIVSTEAVKHWADRPVMVLPIELAGQLARQSYDLYPSSHGFKDLPVKELLHAAWVGNLDDYLASRRAQFVIAMRPDAPLLKATGPLNSAIRHPIRR